MLADFYVFMNGDIFEGMIQVLVIQDLGEKFVVMEIKNIGEIKRNKRYGKRLLTTSEDEIKDGNFDFYQFNW